MGEIIKKAKVPIIIITVLAVAFVIYVKVFKKDPEETGLDRTSEVAGKKTPSQDFLPLLNLIKSVDFDEKFFSDPVFKSMVDFSLPIQEEEKGRENPFSGGIVSSENNIVGDGIVFDVPEPQNENPISTTTPASPPTQGTGGIPE
jgi:hypothetical protein